MACARTQTCYLPKMLETWLRTVLGLRTRRLAIVKGLVEAMGGSVSATSAPGEGTCISFQLPLASDSALSIQRTAY